MPSLERVKPASLAVVACLQPTQLMLLQTAVDRRVDHHRGKRASLRGIAGHFARQKRGDESSQKALYLSCSFVTGDTLSFRKILTI